MRMKEEEKWVGAPSGAFLKGLYAEFSQGIRSWDPTRIPAPLRIVEVQSFIQVLRREKLPLADSFLNRLVSGSIGKNVIFPADPFPAIKSAFQSDYSVPDFFQILEFYLPTGHRIEQSDMIGT